jgi:SAM-dependent methyltransferase
VWSAYETGLPEESVDVIFCIALIHHLEIPRVRDEMWRVLKKGGFVVLAEPIRFSRFYDRVRKLLPSREDVSEFEHPLTREELKCMTMGFAADALRYFRLPFVALAENRSTYRSAYKFSAWTINHFPASQHFATVAVMRLRK